MTTATATLTDFLLARIAEDEREVSGQGPERYEIPWVRKVVAECEAKRLLVEPHKIPTKPSDPRGAHGQPEWKWGLTGDAHEKILMVLATVYADHPDFREGWRP